ncbi:hypothetical protein [Flavobacterium branchiicola]|uniref:Uncharacterized protein n=1 Tax=Flavobacterium branchiicola TaxID=1114875 RepID=A0ABV9P9K7_9FLAO|nr:hypothetical protein [Flavobacterium branchiicola]MBS7253507.1 hypothetical protein [Flavobacterium branchiicola]
MSYLKGLVIDKYKSVDLGIDDTTISNSGYLSDLSLDSINKAITNLNYIITQTTGVITWGVDRFMVDSDPEGSLCKDENDIELADVPNSVMINLLLEIKNFKTQYQNTTNLKNIVGQAFTIIKSNPNAYKRFPNSDFHFATTINDVYITLILEQNDLNLTESLYINQLNTNF